MGLNSTFNRQLLDLILSDMEDLLTAQLISGLSDHFGQLGTLRIAEPKEVTIKRRCYNYSQANWDEMNKSVGNLMEVVIGSEQSFMTDLTSEKIDLAMAKLTSELKSVMIQFVPNRIAKTVKSSHLWLDANCREAIRSKLQAFGTPSYTEKRDACTLTLRNAYARYIGKTKKKMQTLKASWKQRWKIANNLLMKPAQVSSVPPLQEDDGTWHTTGQEKADLLARRG